MATTNNLAYMMNAKNTIPIFQRRISWFSNKFDTDPKDISLGDFLAKGEAFRIQIMHLRNSHDENERKRIKGSLPQAAISGVFFGSRKAENLAAHSGLICIDIDEKDNTDVPDFERLKENVLCNIKEVAYASHSVSGKGYFAIIPLKYPQIHERQFKQLQQDFAKMGITIDKACSDVSRLRCLSYDDAPYINEDAVQYDGFVTTEATQPHYRAWHRRHFADDTDERVYMACKDIEARHIDMTDCYDDWIRIGFSLASLGEQGREYFHAISRQSQKYNPQETDKKFTGFLHSGKGRYSIGTFFHYCKQFGLL